MLRRYMVTDAVKTYLDAYEGAPKRNDQGQRDLYLITNLVKSADGLKRDLFDLFSQIYVVERLPSSGISQVVQGRCELLSKWHLYESQSTIDEACMAPFTRETFLPDRRNELQAVALYVAQHWSNGLDPIHAFQHHRPPKVPGRAPARDDSDPEEEQEDVAFTEHFQALLEAYEPWLGNPDWDKRTRAWAGEHKDVQDCLDDYCSHYDRCIGRTTNYAAKKNTLVCTAEAAGSLHDCVRALY